MKRFAEKDCLAFLFTFLFATVINISGQQVSSGNDSSGNSAQTAIKTFEGKTGDLIISSDHSGALVEIDGKRIPGETPLTLKAFSSGEHRIIVRKGMWYGAQKITVVPGDVSRVTIRMQDGKGTLKVFSDPPGAQIVIDGKIIGTTPLKIINIDAGERMMALRLQGYSTFESSVQITTNETQNITVTLKSSAFISVKAQPRSAAVIINGTPAGTGEVNRMEVPAGDVALSIEAPGYDSYKETVSLKAGELHEVDKTLTAAFGTLTVTTVPPGAALTINGQPSGSTTPYRNDKTAPGNYKLRLELPGYEPIEESVVLKSGETRAFEKKMVSMYGTLSVVTTPSGATLFINGQSSGTTPFRSDKLATGSYRLRLEMAGYEPMEGSVILNAGEPIAIEKKMVSLYGILSLATTPAGAAVIINGKQYGTTPYRNDKLLSGAYSLRLELPGYAGIPEEKITIEKETAVHREYTLSRSKAWLDSVAAFKLAKYKHARWKRRIVFGSLAAVTGGIGYYFDSQVAAAVKDQNKAQADYRAATTDWNTYIQRYNDAGDKAKSNANVRNILYGIAGVFAAGFVISIPF
ncbi:MAG: PEGA domain-containing protein [Chitinispirillaceae bacterium]|jgi:hypothetical protein